MIENQTSPGLERDWRPIAVALAMFVLVIASVAGEMISDHNRLGGPFADVLVLPPGASGLFIFNGSYMPQELGPKVAKIPGVKAVSPVLVQTDGLQQVWGIDPVTFDAVSGGLRYRTGVVFSVSDETVVDDFYAAGNRLQVGDHVKMIGGDLRISGIVEHGRGGRIFISLKAMQERTGMIDKASGFFLKAKNSDGSPSFTSV